MTEDARLLAILDAHGKSFLDAFGPIDTTINSHRKRKANNDNVRANKKARKSPTPDEEDEDEDEDEWTGINQSIDSDEDSGSEDDEEDRSDFEHTDDEFTGETTKAANVVVFSENIPKKTMDDKAQRKAFMSSKVSKLISGPSQPSTSQSRSKTAAEEEDDKTNAQNDALLHKLVHTKLLSGSLNPELDIDGAKKRKALAGRVLEISGSAKLGKGEKSVREAERAKASKNVREGLARKQQQRNKQELEEAKNLGNYHPTLKKMFEASSAGPSRKRQKGLKLGVGTFQGGVLKLRKSDVSSVMPGQSSTRGKKGKSRG
ncbi:hypothetical protein BJ165DRAFT_1521404 [Panaeolus papilionaceus]|nr:hypothetical protein BJ165DRAFT_1521404 [Panaeolus papilionaceus]